MSLPLQPLAPHQWTMPGDSDRRNVEVWFTPVFNALDASRWRPRCVTTRITSSRTCCCRSVTNMKLILSDVNAIDREDESVWGGDTWWCDSSRLELAARRRPLLPHLRRFTDRKSSREAEASPEELRDASSMVYSFYRHHLLDMTSRLRVTSLSTCYCYKHCSSFRST